MDITPTLSWVEVFWVLAGLICLPHAAQNLRQAWLNHRVQLTLPPDAAADWTPDPALVRVAWFAVRRNIVFLFLQTVFLAVGVRACFYPPAVGATWDSSLAGVLLIGAQLALLWLAVRVRRDEAALRRAYAAQHPVEPGAASEEIH